MSENLHRYKIALSDIVVRAALVPLTRDEFERWNAAGADALFDAVFADSAYRGPGLGDAALNLPDWCGQSTPFLGVGSYNGEIEVCDLTDDSVMILSERFRKNDFLDDKIRDSISLGNKGSDEASLLIWDSSSGTIEYSLDIEDEFDRDYLSFVSFQLSNIDSSIANLQYSSEPIPQPRINSELYHQNITLISADKLVFTKQSLA